MDVANDAEVGNPKDGGLFVFVDRDDVLRAFHADHVLRSPRDASSDVHGWLDDLAGLTYLVAVRHPTSVNDGPRRTRRRLKQLGQGLDHREAVSLTETTATSNHNISFVELRARCLLDMNRSNSRPTCRS